MKKKDRQILILLTQIPTIISIGTDGVDIHVCRMLKQSHLPFEISPSNAKQDPLYGKIENITIW